MDTPAEPRSDVIRALGLPKRAGRSTLELVAALETGLPVSALDRVSKSIAPDDASFKYRIVSKATLARRRKGQSLSTEESSRVARIATVWASALQVWQQDEAARAFLFRPHPLLKQRTPIEVAIGTDLGARLVEEILGRLQHGSAA
jgi:putative toxin-antitoxin system antitoxin component (TIGR02293 family)